MLDWLDEQKEKSIDINEFFYKAPANSGGFLFVVIGILLVLAGFIAIIYKRG